MPLAPTKENTTHTPQSPYPNDTSTRDKTIKHTILPAYVDHHLPTEYTEKP